jgi:hypothetical protein
VSAGVKFVGYQDFIDDAHGPNSVMGWVSIPKSAGRRAGRFNCMYTNTFIYITKLSYSTLRSFRVPMKLATRRVGYLNRTRNDWPAVGYPP